MKLLILTLLKRTHIVSSAKKKEIKAKMADEDQEDEAESGEVSCNSRKSLTWSAVLHAPLLVP